MIRAGSKRWTKQYRHVAEREAALERRIYRTLRRIGFDVERVAVYDKFGIRANGINLAASLGGYIVRLAIVLPGHKPDAMQRASVSSDVCAAYVSSVGEAVRLVSVGIVKTDAFGRVQRSYL